MEPAQRRLLPHERSADMKVCVYAICKNEEKFAARWMRSMSEADGVYVLDTGSADSTPELLETISRIDVIASSRKITISATQRNTGRM